MKYATSMFLGGISVLATEADYQSTRKLGCICPICKQAVFLRAGAIRTNHLRNGRQLDQIINPSFCHYKGSPSSDCENRIYSKQGKERIKRFEIEGQNQRLKLYNEKLWQMFARDHNLNRQNLVSNKKFASYKFVEQLAKEAWKAWKMYQSTHNYEFIDAMVEIFAKASEREIEQFCLTTRFQIINFENLQSYADFFHYSGNIPLHKTICHEISNFLGTRTSGYFWQNFIAASIGVFCTEAQISTKQELQRSYTINLALVMAESSISLTRWIPQINQELNITAK
jgi:hypothetical protein